VAEIKILRSSPELAPALTELLYESRSIWNYEKAYVEASKPLLRVTASFIAKEPVFHCLKNNRLIAFYSFCEAAFGMELNNFWVAKDSINQGIGRILWAHVLTEAKAMQLKEFYILPDPGAEDFYLKMGASRTGETLPSRLASGPCFQKLISRLS
jgi:GNAT superfamily N-acetyltransferase